MADKKQLTVEEVLAACRKMDGGGDAATHAEAPQAEAPSEPASPAAKPPAAKPPAAKPPAEKPAGGAKPGQMSVADILAAARGDKKSAPAEQPAAEKPAAEKPAAKKPAAEKPAAKKPAAEKPAAKKPAAEKPAAEQPAAKPAAAAKSGSVADILAAARAEKGAAAAKPAAAPPSAKPAAAKPAAAKPAVAATEAGPKDTASILAAARKTDQPGPVSKAEAAAKGRPVAPSRPALPPMPERPAFLDAQAAGPGPENRRTFFGSFAGLMFGSSLAVGFSSLFVTNLLWLLGLARFMFPNILTEPPTVFKVGFPDDYAPGQVETKYVAQGGVWIVRYEYNGQAQIYALRTVCTHLGCTPNWLEAEQKFKCPCHGSGFYKDGINFEGPAPRPLERYAISLADDGQLQVDKSRKFQEELGQWKDAASSVNV